MFCAVIFSVVLGIFLNWKFNTSKNKINDSKICYEFKALKVPNNFKKEVNLEDKVLIKNKDGGVKGVGVVKSLDISSCQEAVFNKIDAIYKVENIPGACDIRILLESDAKESESTIKVGDLTILVGLKCTLENKNYFFEGTISDILNN